MANSARDSSPKQGQEAGAVSKNECHRRFADVARSDEEREARSQANAIANAASTLSQQCLESHGPKQPDERHRQQRSASPSLEKPPREADPRSRIDSCRISHYNS